MLTDLINTITGLVDTIGYPGLALSMFIESLFAPIPSELILPFAGFLSRNGDLNIYVVILISGVFSALGSFPFYLLGYWGNEVVLNKFLKKYGKYLFIKDDDVAKGVAVFQKHGEITVFLGRLVPIIRSVISFPAGVAKMNIYVFSMYTLLGSTLWSAVLCMLGYMMGSQWEKVNDWIAEYQTVVIYVIGILVLLYLAKKVIEYFRSK